MYVHIKSGMPYSEKQIKAEFEKLRREDDEFARDYARHEFNLWVKERYKHVPDQQTFFKTHADAYNQLRGQMIFDYRLLCEKLGIKPQDVKTATCDELLGLFQELELQSLQTEKL
jgi:DNA transposition AAA+ family ATPase